MPPPKKAGALYQNQVINMTNKRISYVLLLFSALFLALIVYLTTIDLYYRDEYASNNLNARSIARESNVMRGSIYDRNGETLAYSKMDDGVQKRYYPYINLYAHVIGYSSKTYGKSLLEKSYNADLLGQDNINAVFNLKNLLKGEMSAGNSLTLTIDHPTQQKADQLMSKYRGALVALDPQTGAILAMVSKPDFNPNETYLNQSWSELSNSDDAPFLTRATMGLYPPGSTYKMITSALIIEEGLDNTVINDTGSVDISGHTIGNTRGNAYGQTDLESAFRNSSNVFFADVGSQIKGSEHQDIAKRFGFNQSLEFDFPYNKSKFQTGGMSQAEIAMASIGQGKTLLSPLHLAMITGAFANDGTMMRPYLVSEVNAPTGFPVKTAKPSTLSQPVTPTVAKRVKDMMLDVVESGTGGNAKIRGVQVGGKTGTAENEKTTDDPESTHALFVAYAPYDDPQIAVAVILEYAGHTGGSIAAPIARDVIRTYLGE